MIANLVPTSNLESPEDNLLASDIASFSSINPFTPTGNPIPGTSILWYMGIALAIWGYTKYRKAHKMGD